MSVSELIKTSLFGNIDTSSLIIQLLLALGLIITGIIIGKLVNYGLRKLFRSIELEKKIRIGLLDLFRAIVRWSIYIVFLSFGLNQLGTTNLTKAITSILIIIPAFVGALIFIILGFSVAYFLRRVIKESGIKGVEILSEIVFYFVIYISGVYSVKTALVPLGDPWTSYLILILTAVFGAVAAYFLIKRHSG